MKKIFGFGGRKGVSPLGLSNGPGSSRVGDWRKSSNRLTSPYGYHIQDKDLGKIHRAATVGNVAKVKQILLLRLNGVDDTDKMNRTALHLACANGHAGVVTLLADRKCLLNLIDNENKTALIKAVQCQEEACATILLDRGADPNIMDVDGNTALHHAVLGQNTAIVAKLLAHQANIEARNKDDLTPLSLAVSENKEKMVEFLVNRGAKVDQLESNHQLTSEYKGERRPKMCSESSKSLADIDLQESPKQVSRRTNSMTVVENSEEDSLSRLSSKPDIDDSWPTSDDEDFDFDAKNVMKPSLTKLMTAIQQSHENSEAKYAIVRPENRALCENDTFHSEIEDVIETLPKTSEKVQDFSQPAFLSVEPLLKASHMSLEVIGLPKEEATKPAIKIKGNCADIIESAPQNQTNNNNLTYVDGEYKNNSSDKMATLGLGEDEDRESLWDSEESFSASLSQRHLDHLTEDVGSDKRSEITLNGQVEDSPGKYCLLKPTVEVKDPVPEKAVRMDFVQTSRSEILPIQVPLVQTSTWLLTQPSLALSQESCSRPCARAGASAALVPTQVPDLSAELDLEVTSEGEQERLDGSENNHPRVEEEKKMHNSSEVDVIENMYNADADDSDGLIQQRKSQQTDKQPFLIIGNEYSDRSAKKTSHEEKTFSEENKVKEKFNSMDDLDDLTQSSETFSEHCELPYSNCRNFILLIEQLGMDCKDSVSLLKIQDAILSYERLIELKKNHCEILTGKIKRMENRVSELQKELSETKEMKSQLEHQKVEWEQEICNLRFTLKEEKEKRRNMDVLYDKIREQLRKKEEQYIKVVEMNQQLETTLRTLEMELKIVKKNLNQVIEERNGIQSQLSREQNARTLQDGILTNRLCKQKEIQIAHDKINSEVSDNYEKEKNLLHENHMLQDEIATLRLEIDTIKNQNQEMEKKYFEDIAVVKENNDFLQKAIKVNEETFTKTVSQYNGQLNALTAENTILKSKLETEKQNKERLETEIESYRSRLATAVEDHEQSETSKRDLQRDFQRARDEWFRLRDKMNCGMSDLEDRNEILSQQLSKAESKFNSLEIELHHTRDALRERTLVLEGVQRDLSQTQCQKKEIEHMYQKEQGKVNKYIGKQGSLEERLSQLQSENVLLRRQVEDAHNKADSKEKTVINIQDQFQDIIKIFQAESEKQALMLNERNKELINECNHLKERMNQYENGKAERDAMVRQLQQELADTLKKQSMSEASLEVTSRYRMDLEEETQDLKQKLDQVRSQLQEAQDRYAAAERCAEETEEHLQKLEIENANLNVTIKEQSLKIEQLQTILSQDEREQLKKYIELKQSLEYGLDQEMKKNSELEKELIGFKKLLKITKRKLNEYENGERSFPGDLKPNQSEVDIQINMLKHKNDDLTAKLETASSKCQRLDEKNKCLQQELLSVKALQKKCEKLKNEKKKWKQEGINLKTHMEMNMVEFSELEQYKRKIEERARQDIEEKLEEVNLFLQTQAASQENLEQLREHHNASIRSQLELRIKDLESELSKIKISQNSKEINLEKYKQLYLEEIESRKSLANILNKTNERLAELSTDLLLQKQQNRSLLSTLHPKPGLEMPCVGNSSLVFYGDVTPRGNFVIPTSRPQTSRKSMETYLIKMQQEFEKTLTRELKEDAAEFDTEACRAYPVASTDQANSSQDLLLKTSREYAQILQKNYMI
ncbi:ankyrin repeat domain-containing protein 26 isoform X2 [Desmodus rotundus]|uniref:ankyrin repeat domain-containing protein 26 isoform X2 n=1 Tax=Desmodus rotundus TaxID=9430 RepID=UPI002380DCC6|nr:ankyrin repeat domain-containing protein 26 isoform X2 [Desmodus rotundus]